MQFVPLPLMKPLQPSSFHIFMSPFPTDILYSSRPALCIWNRIFNRSSGETTVLEIAPATPPAQNAAKTGCERTSRICSTLGPYLGFRVSFSDYKRSQGRSGQTGGYSQQTFLNCTSNCEVAKPKAKKLNACLDPGPAKTVPPSATAEQLRRIRDLDTYALDLILEVPRQIWAPTQSRILSASGLRRELASRL